ncbi:MAG: phytanoyl-CoA dioxygenase family protein [Candidatus Methylacidiphilales bacterium]
MQHILSNPVSTDESLCVPIDIASAAPLNDDQIKQFQESGYIAFANVLGPDELAASREALRDIARSTISSPEDYEARKHGGGAYFQHRSSPLFVQIEPGHDPAGMSADALEDVVRKYMWFSGAAPIFSQLLAPQGLIARIVSSIVGTDPILFQEMALVKPPWIGSEKPWHQDNAYFSVAPLDAVVGVWIALDDALPENGCMHVLPGGHKGGPLRHYHGTDCEIVRDRLDTSGAVPVPVPAGGALFFYGLLPHETPPNRSARRRRALQFHYRAATSQIVDEELYNTIFAESDGTPASCRAASALRKVM